MRTIEEIEIGLPLLRGPTGNFRDPFAAYLIGDSRRRFPPVVLRGPSAPENDFHRFAFDRWEALEFDAPRRLNRFLFRMAARAYPKFEGSDAHQTSGEIGIKRLPSNLPRAKFS